MLICGFCGIAIACLCSFSLIQNRLASSSSNDTSDFGMSSSFALETNCEDSEFDIFMENSLQTYEIEILI